MIKAVMIAVMAVGGASWLMAADSVVPATGPSKELTLDVGGGLAMKLVLIPAGKFIMGDPDDKKDAIQHEVTITKPFYMGICEVTQAQYQQVMGKNPVVTGNRENTAADKPVTMIVWPEAAEFCKKLSAQTGRTVRLPTEAEWEYAARAGTTTHWSFGNDVEELPDYCWWSGCSGGNFTNRVGRLKPNPWGLYDIHGNVWEMCSDWRAPYEPGVAVDPQGPDVSKTSSSRIYNKPVHVCRGGSYYSGACTILGRYGYPDDFPKRHIGFRVVVNAE